MEEIKSDLRKPTIVLPYMKTRRDDSYKDLFLYLRPETNGIKVESPLFNVIYNNPTFRTGIELVYLANIPGDFVTKNRVIENHYSLKCKIAREGKECFTPLMRERFEQWYKVKWDDVEIITAYQALEKLNISSKELFNLWVNDRDFFYVHGQSIKKIGALYVINYDIPELLKINSVSTDIAVMVLRTSLSNRDITTLITEMEKELKRVGAVDPKTPPRRCFHYTKSPLEEILDGTGYLYDDDCTPVPFENISYVDFLLKKGLSIEYINSLVVNPIVTIVENGLEQEVYLYDYLMGDSYEEAFFKISNIKK
ncbi:MAG: hypothetical protein JXR64_13495 [Spirochaetales bacterium]|nr:hypothetical protein [Spirochaetales bacterium]